MTVVHWDDVDHDDDLAVAVGAGWACLRRVTITPGEPLHLGDDERETVVWTLDRDAVLVRRPQDVERSVRAEGTLELLVFAIDAPRPDPLVQPRPSTVVRPSELEGRRHVDGLTSVTRYDVGEPIGTVGVTLELIDVHPGRRSAPVLDLEELTVVLRGTGQARTGGQEPWVTRGSVIGQGERYIAGPQGLRLLCFRERTEPPR